MSNIPNSAMPKAKQHDPDAAPKASTKKKADRAETLTDRASAAADAATAAVKANPKTALAIGATLVAGIAAAVAGPAVLAKAKDDPKKGKATKPKAK